MERPCFKGRPQAPCFPMCAPMSPNSPNTAFIVMHSRLVNACYVTALPPASAAKSIVDPRDDHDHARWARDFELLLTTCLFRCSTISRTTWRSLCCKLHQRMFISNFLHCQSTYTTSLSKLHSPPSTIIVQCHSTAMTTPRAQAQAYSTASHSSPAL